MFSKSVNSKVVEPSKIIKERLVPNGMASHFFTQEANNFSAEADVKSVSQKQPATSKIDNSDRGHWVYNRLNHPLISKPFYTIQEEARLQALVSEFCGRVTFNEVNDFENFVSAVKSFVKDSKMVGETKEICDSISDLQYLLEDGFETYVGESVLNKEMSVWLNLDNQVSMSPADNAVKVHLKVFTPSTMQLPLSIQLQEAKDQYREILVTTLNKFLVKLEKLTYGEKLQYIKEQQTYRKMVENQQGKLKAAAPKESLSSNHVPVHIFTQEANNLSAEATSEVIDDGGHWMFSRSSSGMGR